MSCCINITLLLRECFWALYAHINILKGIFHFNWPFNTLTHKYRKTGFVFIKMHASKQTAITEEVLMLLYLLPFYSPPNSGSDGPNQKSVQRKSPCPKVLFLSNFISFLWFWLHLGTKAHNLTILHRQSYTKCHLTTHEILYLHYGITIWWKMANVFYWKIWDFSFIGPLLGFLRHQKVCVLEDYFIRIIVVNIKCL